MAADKRSFTGLLRKPIRLDEARAPDLHRAFALPPTEADVVDHIDDELEVRWAELDRCFGLDGTPGDVWEHRAKTLIAHDLGIAAHDQNWWGRLATRLACRQVPGFSIKYATQRKRGAPTKWTSDRLAELFADIEYLKRNRKVSIYAACGILARNKRYEPRWGKYQPKALEKSYLQAKKQRGRIMFELNLCGPDALIADNRINRVEAAIERHALKT
jgi:hypothetical protein